MTIQLEIKDVAVSFGGLVALHNVNLHLKGPGTIGLIGPNGAGKSTLLNALSGFVRPTEGTILLDHEDITALSPELHAKAGVVRSFQTAQLLEDETVITNLLLGRQRFSSAGALRQLFGSSRHRKSERAWLNQAYATLDLLKLVDYADVQVSSLSTATRRLVEIGRVLMAEPRVIFLDEPAAGLDSGSREQLAAILRDLPSKVGCLLILVEHDVNIVRKSCDRCIALVAGTVLAEGPTDQVLDRADVRLAYFGESHALA